ncbi:MAG: mucoidy inhibitor MuiA family protein [Candidatus Krumholzibacteriia bacterium]
MKTRRTSARSGSFAIALSLAALAFSILCSFSVGASDEKEIPLDTRIAAATVYADRAQVTRTGAVELKTGLYKLVCGDLPRSFDESSLQVEGKGTARSRIMGIDVVKVRGLAEESPRYKELKDKLERLTARRDTLQIEHGALTSSAQFLDDFAKLPFDTGSTKLTTEIFRVQDWKNVLEFIGSERVKTNERIGGLNRRIMKLAEEINWIAGRLNEMQTKDDWSRRVVVDCEIASPGTLELAFTYNVRGAQWGPEYQIRYDTAKESIELAYNAWIKQFTGEDWKNVAVTLSTARPQIGAAPPEIVPLYLQRSPRPRPMAEELARGRAMKSSISVTSADAAQAEAPAEEYEAEIPGAELASSEFAASFSIPKSVDLPSGKDPRRVLILQGTLTGKLSRYTAPRFSQNVYVTGAVTNSLEAPLLSGPADVYIESAAAGAAGKTSTFVGKEHLKAVVAGQEFPVHLGIDQDIKVTFKLEKKEYLTKEGAPVRKIRYSYLITIESFKKDAASVKLQDRIPVSTIKEVKVTNVDLEPKPAEEREDGILTWNLSPAPKQKIEIRIAYATEFPGDWDEYSLNLE